jgi:sugar lactone lactonase YvrE
LDLAAAWTALASDARFLSPRGIAVDKTGNVYVADSGNLTLRKITPAGVVTTLAGAPGASGSLDGAGSSARFTAPVALAVNAAGNLVVADGSAIRAVSPFGNVTTLAGVVGVPGAADETGAKALFASPQGVALDTAGNVYVADTYNQTIRKVSSAGVVTTLAGAVGMTGSAEGIGTVARFAYPAGICVDALGNLVVTEWDSAKVRLGTLVDAALQIRTQPANASVLEGSRAALSVTATGMAPFSYRWRKAGIPISGAVGPVFVLPAAAPGDAGLYDVEVTDAKASVTSQPAQLSVYTAEQLAVKISAQPIGATVSEGGLAQLSVSASSLLPMAYQWSKDGVPLVGQTSAALVVPNVAFTDAGTYSVVASHAYGSATSAGAVLVVSARPPGVPLPTIVAQPQNLNVAAGSLANFFVAATGPGTLSYQWRKGGVAVTGGTASAFSIVAVQAGDAGSYDVVVTSGEGGSVTSSPATLTVGGITPPPTAPVITSQPVAQSVFSGASATFRVAATGNPAPTYQWRKGGQPISGATSSTLTLPNVRSGDAAAYDVVVSNNVNSITSSAAVLMLRMLPASGAGNWTTLAGSPGGAGSVDGPAADARLSAAVGVAVDRVSGVVYFSDNHTIRKLATDGMVSTLAGVAGLTGRTDGKGGNARFNAPAGLAVSPDGNLFVADSGNHCIRKVTSDGTVTLFAGSNAGLSGASDGTGTDARFFTPNALAFDALGNLFVTDSGNLTVRKITQQGVVSTFAGSAGNSGTNDGTGAAARFADLLAICGDPQNNLFVLCDAKIRKVTSAGVVTTEASVYKPAGIALDNAGNLFFTTRDNPLKKIAPGGTTQTFAGSGVSGSEDGTGSEARFWSPKHCAFDGFGNLLVVDSGNNLLRKVTPGAVVTTVIGTGALASVDGKGFAARFRLPNAVASDAAGNLYVADTGNHTIRKVSPAGVVTTVAGTPAVSGNTDGPAQTALFNNPTGIAVDSLGALYVADSGNNRIRKISGGLVAAYAGAVDATAGFVNASASLSRFDRPQGLVFDGDGSLVVADTDNHAIRRIAPNGTVSTFAGGTLGRSDGTGTGAQFTLPDELAFDGAGNLFVSQATYVDTIRKITSGGVVTTPAFTAKRIGGLAFAADGVLYVSDPDSLQTVWKILPDGTVSRFTTGGAGSTDGSSAVAKFNWPAGMVRRADGALALVDSRNGRIRLCTLVDTPLTVAVSLSSAVVAAGARVTFGAEFTGSGPVAYQWRKNGINIAGETSGTYSITSAQMSDAGDYDVVVANALGPVVSQMAALVVTGGVTIGAHPVSQTVVAGASASFSVTATGPGTLLYQWRKAGIPIPGATAATFSIASAQAADAGLYDVLVRSGAGASEVSNGAALTVTPAGLAAPVITVHPASASRSAGDTAVFTVLANGAAPLRYQWRKNGVPIANANYLSYKILSVSAADVGNYDVLISNPLGNTTSAVATLATPAPTNAAPVITEQPAAVAVYPGVEATFRVGVTGFPAPTFQWRKGGVPIAGGTSASYKIASAAAADAASYDVVVTNGMGNVTSAAAVLTLSALPKGAGEWLPLAGNPANSGIVDGKGPDARFYELHGITRDELGNLYVVDAGSLRKITPEGVVSTIVDNQLNVDAAGLARDRNGNFYVATGRAGGYVIKVSASGQVTTLAGDPSANGNADGNRGYARFGVLAGITVLDNGTVYVVDNHYATVRKISSDGTVTTPAGNASTEIRNGYADGTGTVARFSSPLGITHDAVGNLYVADAGNNRIRKVTPQGVVTTLAAAGLSDPGDVSMDGAGNLYVTDRMSRVIRKITPAGVLSTVAGISGIQGSNDGTALQAKFGYVPALVADPLGTLYVSDAGNRKIRKVSPGGDITTLAGAGGLGNADGIGSTAQFNSPAGVAVDPSGNIFVTDIGNDCIRKVTRNGVVSTFKTGLNVGAAIAVDRNGGILVGNRSGLVRVTKEGVVINVAGSTTAAGGYLDGEASTARFGGIHGIVALPDDTIYVSEGRAGNVSGVIRKVTPAGMVSTFVGSPSNPGGHLDGPPSVATFNDLHRLAVSKSGNFYVAQFHSIRKIDPRGNVTTHSGGVGPSVYWQPQGVAVDADEIVYVADTLNNRVRRVGLDRTVTTIGTGFRAPKSIAVDPDGNLILADAGNHKLWVGILKDTPLRMMLQPTRITTRRGESATFVAEVQGSLPLLYQWRKNGEPIAGEVAATYSIPSVQSSDVGVYDVVIANGAGAITSEPATLSLTTDVTLPVTITVQPRDVVVNLANPLELSVTATGSAPLTYQWRKDGVEIPSATARTYSIPVVDLSSGGYYDVVVTNAAGSVLSEPALVEINGMGNVPPSIRTQPPSLQGVVGGFVTFTAGVAGSAPLSYQWRKGGTPIPGATTAAYTLNGLRAADAGSYDVVVSNRAGSANSAAAVLTVNNPLAIVTPPAPLTVTAGNYAFFSVTASGTAPITYQWRKDGEPLEGGTASFYEIPAAQAVHAGSYDVVVANPGNSLTSKPAALTLQQGGGAQIALVAQPVNTGALPGGAASFSVSATGTAPISYQWRRNGVAIAGANGPVYGIGAVQASAVGSYDVVVGNWSGEVTSTKATLSLYSPVSITAHPLSRSVATGTAATFSVTATGTAPLAYQWRKNGQSIAGATQAAYTIGAAQAVDEGVYDVVLTNPAGSALSNAAALAVGPKPVLVKGPSGATVLAGGSLTLSVSATGDGVTYQWRRNGSNIPGATAPVLTLRNLKAADAGRFEVVVANAYGAVSPAPAADVAVHVPVSFTRHPEGALLREGAAATLSVQATGTAPLAYQWRRNGMPIPGATRFTYSLSNASSETAGTYDVVVTNPVGAFVSEAAQISVSVALGIVRQPVGASVTQGSAVTLSVLAKGSGELKYAWYKWRDTGAPLLVGTLSTLSFPSAAPGDAGTYSVLVTGNGTPVFSDRVTVAVSSARGVAVLRQPEDASLAEGAAVGVRTVINAGDVAAKETRYTLCALRNGMQVATDVTGVVPETGVLDVPLRRVNAGGAYVVRFDRVYTDGGTATAVTQPFYLSVRGRTEAVGTYEGLLVDANVEGVPTDGAGARGCITVSLSKTGSVSGRVQYVEAGSLAGAPSAALRVYVPVSRSFTGVLAPSPLDPLKLVANLKLGTGSQAGRQELALVLDQSADEPLLTATVTDRVSEPGPEAGVSVADGLRRNLSAAPARAVGRYALAAPPAVAVAGDNNAQLLVQVLPSGRALWASRLTGYSGSGFAGLMAPSESLLLAPLYEGRATMGATLLTTSALFGELRFAQALDGGWDLALGADRLEQVRSRVTGSRGMGGFAAAYSEAEFAVGTNLSGARVLDFGGASGSRIQSTLLGTLFAPDAPGLKFVSADPLAGGSLGFSWNVTVSGAGVVRTSGISMGGVTPPVLSLRLDKVRGEWSGSYVTGGVRRSLIGCVLDSASSRGRGWFESGAAAGRWELRLGE